MARGWNRNKAMGRASAPAAGLLRGIHCPITRGNHTRMATDTYRRLCLALRDETNHACSTCRGGQQPPAELELTDMAALLEAGPENTINDTEVNVMSTFGERELCGKQTKLRSIRNKMACGTCEHIWRAANVQPEAMLRMIAEVKGDGWLQANVPQPVTIDQQSTGDEPQRAASDILIERIITTHQVDSGTDIAAFVDNLVADVDKANRDNISLRETMVNTERRLHAAEQVIENARIAFGIEDKDTSIIEAVTKVAQRLRDIREAIQADPKDDLLEAVQRLLRDRQKAVDVWTETAGILGLDEVDCGYMPMEAREMVDELQQLRQKVASLEETVAGELIYTELDVRRDRTAALLDLAIDVIAGKVSGLDAERIAALR